MKALLLAAAAATALFAGAAGAQTAAPARQAPASSQPTAAEARSFIARIEPQLARAGEAVNRAGWVRATNITPDTEWLEAQATTAFDQLAVQAVQEGARYRNVQGLDAETRRKLEVLPRLLVLPPPQTPGAAEELANLRTRLDGMYSTGRFTYQGRQITLNDAERLLRTSRDPNETRALWEGWHSIAPPMRPLYARMVELSNQGAREIGYADTGALWRSWYDMEPDAFAAETDRLWRQVEPFYRNLHCYVRARLNARYGDAVQPRTGPIRADLLGNMWAQQWGNVYDVVAPQGQDAGYDLTNLLTTANYDAERMVRTGERFYTSLGFAALPQTFWERSMITRPQGREVVCHASAWDIDDQEDIRIKMCTEVNGDDFYTVHHELGHNIYQRAYARQPYLLRSGANDGFHEAIGDFVGLSALTPTYLRQVGLLNRDPGAGGDTPFLLRMAMDKIAFLPFGLMVDRWRWDVFSGRVQPAEYNQRWTELRRQYQGITPPGERPADAFDPGAKYHVPGNTPYTRYFLAHIYQFQFHRAACRQAGFRGPLHRCSIYDNPEVGRRFNAMLEMGQSRPWPEALAAFTGERQADASAIAEYFAPLNTWLQQQNRGQQCGW